MSSTLSCLYKDEKRTRILNKYKLEVLRFSNLDIDKNFSGVCTKIEETIKKKTEQMSDSGF